MTDIFRKYHAKAIWKDNAERTNVYLRFQTEFDARQGQPVQFYICTDTKYELYINGQLAGFGQYEDYPDRKIYDCHDISACLKDGSNLVSILVYSLGEDSQQHLAGLPMVIFAAVCGDTCLLASGEQVKCDEAEEFLSGPFETITFELSYNFRIDLRKEDGWRARRCSEHWPNAVLCDDSGIPYFPRPLAKLELLEPRCGQIVTQGEFEEGPGDTVAKKMQYAALAFRQPDDVMELDGQTLRLKKDQVFWIADLGREMAGYFVLDVEAEEGAVLDVAYGEHLADQRVRCSIARRNYAFRITCRNGRQQIRFYIRRLAGRYLQFFAHKGIHAVHEAGLHEVQYPLSFQSSLHMNDRLFNRIYEVSLRTLHLCMHDHYEDCPQREQSLYGMDSRNQMLAGYYAFGETAMPRASLMLLAQGQKESGLLEICAPATYERTIPSFSLAWVCALKEYVLFSGDTDFAAQMLPYAEKLMHFFRLDAEYGLIARPQEFENWNFYEWTDGMKDERDPSIRFDAPLNALYRMALLDYCDLCRWSGILTDLPWAQETAETIFGAFHRAFYCPEMQAYKTYIDNRAPHFAQLTQAWALVGGCVPEVCQAQIRESACSDRLVAISLSHSVFQYDALMQDPERYAGHVLDDIEKKWGHMLYQGATSFWETILGAEDFGRAGSLCHGWSATPAYIFWRYVMGIYPKAPGFEEIAAKPLCAKELAAEGTLKTPHGIYRAVLSDGHVTVAKQI